MNTYGTAFRVTIFGESHGECIAVLIDGCPPGVQIAESEIQRDLDRRRPGKNALSTSRNEPDIVKIMSGIRSEKTTGAPIAMLIENKDTDSSKYDFIKHMPRPGHADFTARHKYGGNADHRGGGMFSGRTTAALVMAGAVAKKILASSGTKIAAQTIQVGKIKSKNNVYSPALSHDEYGRLVSTIESERDKNDVYCADDGTAKEMIGEILAAKSEGDSVGGAVECIIIDAPIGFGEPYFDTLEGEISKMMFAIPAVKGVEFGAGFDISRMRGSQANDQFYIHKKANDKSGAGKTDIKTKQSSQETPVSLIRTRTNHSGGILGGISSGMPIVFRIAIKPTASISKKQRTVRYDGSKEEDLIIEGRHDPCIVPRAVPVVEAGAAIVLADMMMRTQSKA